MRRKRSGFWENCAALLILIAVTLTVLFQLFAKPFLLTFGASGIRLASLWIISAFMPAVRFLCS